MARPNPDSAVAEQLARQTAIIGRARLEAPVDQQPERTDLLRPQQLFRPPEVGMAGRPGRHDKVALPHDPQDFANPVAKPPGAVADGVDHSAVHKPPERFSRRRVAAYPMQFVHNGNSYSFPNGKNVWILCNVRTMIHPAPVTVPLFFFRNTPMNV